MTDTLVHFQSVDFSYHLEPVIQNLDWHWRRGENWALSGGNGSGKTTLARLLCDELRPQRGQILRAIEPQAIMHLSFDLQRQLMARDRRFDNSNEREDAFDNGTTVAALILGERPADDAFHELCERLGLGPILRRGIRYISTGESRKTLLAKALLTQPSLLILDNPLEGLDQQARAEIQAIINQLLAGPMPTLLISKDPADIPAGLSQVLNLQAAESAPDIPAPPLPISATSPKAADHPLAIKLDGVNVSFRETPVLRDIHWQLRPGQHCHIVGPNGAGKSTLLGLLCGDNDKAYGQPVELFGRRRGSGESIWDIKALFGVVSTAAQLTHLGRLGVTEVVASGFFDSIGLYRDCSPDQRQQIFAWLQALSLWPQRKRRFAELSFGEQRLALLARAMIKSPRILILDEPCIGLDHQQRDKILSIVDRIANSGHTQILYVSHDNRELPNCINQTLRLVPAAAGGSTAELLNHPIKSA